MRRLALVFSILFIAGSCFGQRLTGTFSGWGSVARPGTGFPPGTLRGRSNSGYRGGAYRTGTGYGPGHRGRVGVPYFVGGYGFGGLGYDGYGYASDPSGYSDTNGGSPVPPPISAAPPVVINQYFGTPAGPAPTDQDEQSVRIYSQPSAAQPLNEGQASPDARTYLIAYRDHSVYTALAYWVEGHTLHYVTTSNTHNQADLSLIDLDFTQKLNQDRGMPVSFNR